MADTNWLTADEAKAIVDSGYAVVVSRDSDGMVARIVRQEDVSITEGE